MATVTVVPNADGTGAANWTITGGPSTRYGAINNGTASPDDTDYIRNSFSEGGSAETAYFGFADMPVDFDAATSVTVKIRQKCYANDDDAAKYRLYAADGSTPLSDEIELNCNGSGVSSAYRTDTLNFTRTGSTTKTTWDGVQLKVTHVGPGDGDDPELYISEVDLEIVYSALASGKLLPFVQAQQRIEDNATEL